MNLFVIAGLLAAATVVMVGPMSTWVARSDWVTKAPRSAIALWQAIGVGAAIAAIGAGLCVAVERFHSGFASGVSDLISGAIDGHPLRGLGLPDALGLTLAVDLTIVLACLMGVVIVRTVLARSRHRRLLNLLAGTDPGTSGADVLEHASAVAYCLPGIRPRIVISAGAMRLLTSQELAAVIEHERGHAREHHALVMLPMTGWSDLFRWIPYARLAPRSIALLLEMAADDYACREHHPTPLASALIAMAGTGHSLRCAFSIATDGVPLRVSRLLSEERTSRRVAVRTGLLAAAMIAIPLSLMVIS